MKIQMLNGVSDLYLQPNGVYGMGCPSRSCSHLALGAVSNYETITVGGKTYTANQLLDKTVIAGKDTKLYSNASGSGTVVGIVKAGQPIGKVFSYLRPDQADGRSWLMFETSTYNKFYFVPNEAASSTGLQEQGTKTVDQEVKEEEERLQKENDPLLYYLKKIAVPAVLILGGIVLASTVGKETVRGLFNKKSSPAPSPAPALSGPKRKRKKS